MSNPNYNAVKVETIKMLQEMNLSQQQIESIMLKVNAAAKAAVLDLQSKVAETAEIMQRTL